MKFNRRNNESRHKRISFFSWLRNTFLTGLVIVMPAMLTIYLVWAFVGFVDNQILPFVPDRYNLVAHYEMNVRGFGIVVFFLFTTLIGIIFKGIAGRQLLHIGENLVDRVPVVRTLYNGSKQIIETITDSSKTSFNTACLIEYPRKGVWAVAFVATETTGEILVKSNQKTMVSVFLPTTPNPTSGFLLFIPKDDIKILNMSFEEAARLIISAGLVLPTEKKQSASHEKTDLRFD